MWRLSTTERNPLCAPPFPPSHPSLRNLKYFLRPTFQTPRVKYCRYLCTREIVVNSQLWNHIYLFSTVFRLCLEPSLPHIQRILEIKRPRRKAGLSPMPSAEIENEWTCTSTPSSAFMTCRGTFVTSAMRLYWGCDVLVRWEQWRTQEFCSGRGGSTNSVEDRGQRERGSGGDSPLVRGSGGSCNLVQEISFHIIKFS